MYRDLTDEQQEQIYLISDILNESEVWGKIEKALDIELDSNSDMYSEVEEFILYKITEYIVEKSLNEENY
tara:strand:- start:1401 stop:1610 length:210 start_codon:yes stop_codon:yes gene_type:complete